MRYLRMLSNAVIAGGLASGYLAVLVLQLNPAFPLDVATVTPLAVVLALAYGANLTVVFYALIVLRQILAVEVLSPGWLSVRLLSWLCTIAAGGGATMMWLNLRGFGDVLDAGTVSRMAAGATAVSVAAIVFLLIGLAHLGRRGGRASATMLSATMVLSIVVPVAARGPAQLAVLPPEAPTTPADLGVRPGVHVTLLMLDGATLDMISPAVAAGRLPNFGRILERGAALHLATLRPTQAEPVWSAVATGRLPIANGIRSAVVYRILGGDTLQLLPDYCYAQILVSVGFVTEEVQTSESLTSRPLWRILSDHDVSVGVIGWPLTHPAPAVNGFVVSERFHGLSETAMTFEGPSAVSPPGLLAAARAALDVPAQPDPVALVSTMGAAQPVNDYDARLDPTPVGADRIHLQLLNGLSVETPTLLAARFPGIDAVGHLFLRYAQPSAFGDVSEEERQKFGRVLDQYYGFVDTLVGREMARLGPDDILLVVSAFGMEPLSPGKRVLEIVAGNPQISGTHERAPDGFVLAYGRPIAAGRPPRATVVDLAPTILYFLGLPVGRDMDGFARTDLFTAAFTRDKPVTYIPTYGR